MMETRGVIGEEEGKKKVGVDPEVPRILDRTWRPDTVRFFERKLVDKGIARLDRHPADGLGGLHQVPKSGHGGNSPGRAPLTRPTTSSIPFRRPSTLKIPTTSRKKRKSPPKAEENKATKWRRTR